MTIRILVTAVGIVLLLASPGWAQSTTTTSSTATPTGNFDSLSPGNQKIANALFSAQTTTGTKTALTKNQIAGLKSTEGWGKVLQTMKADGLVQAKNLGQVVSGYQHSLRSSTTSTARSGTRTTTTAGATTRSGRSMTRSSGRFSSAGITNGRGFTTSSHAMGGGAMGGGAMGGGFGHGGMGGGGVGGGGFSHGGGGGGGFGGGGGHGR